MGQINLPAESGVNPVVKVRYNAIIPQDVSRYQLADGETVLAPELDEMVVPEFPPSLMTDQERVVRILTHLVINAEGEVSRIIFDDVVHENEHEGVVEAFKISILAAVKQWRFLPMVMVRPMLTNAEGKERNQYIPMPVSLWYQFEFLVKNGEEETMINVYEP